MSLMLTSILSDADIRSVHESALGLLRRTGVRVHHGGVLRRMEEVGAAVDPNHQRVRFPEELVMRSVQQAGKTYVLHGRDRRRTARFGQGELNVMSSPGQRAWIDSITGDRRSPTLADSRAGIRLADALPNISIVGALAQPAEVPDGLCDVLLTAELVKGTTKPGRAWVRSGRAARQVLEIYRAVAGGSDALRQHPLTETFLEPISPLQFPQEGLDAVLEFAQAGQPISVNPMSMVSGTAPGTLAGALVLEHAEILAGIVIVQTLEPGSPVLYGGIPHVLDPRTSLCSFGSPEQGLMAVAMVQLGRSLGFPVYVNVGLTDSKVPDAQAGIEKAASFVAGALAGADLVGHAGICGADHGASLEWLALDDELASFVCRIRRGLGLSPEELAAEVIESVGPGGNFLAEEHTVRHFRKQLWIPSEAWERRDWEAWKRDGAEGMTDRLRRRVQDRLARHEVPPLEPALEKEIDRIVHSAREEWARL